MVGSSITMDNYYFDSVTASNPEMHHHVCSATICAASSSRSYNPSALRGPVTVRVCHLRVPACHVTPLEELARRCRLAGGANEWRTWVHIFLLSPNVEAALGSEYGLLDNVAPLKECPEITFCDK